MRVRMFTFRYSSTLGGFDDTALLDFIRDREVLSFREHFFLVHEVPHVLGVVVYQDEVIPASALSATREVTPASGGTHGSRDRRRSEPPAALGERDRVLWSVLRDWRSQRAREDGVPAYVVLRDSELTAIVAAKPESATALGHVPGIGPQKVKAYGSAILGILNGPRRPEAAPAPPAAVAAPSAATSPGSTEGAPWKS